MTRNQKLRAHRRLWRWLAKHPEMNKSDWPGWKANGGRYEKCFADCFVCAGSGCEDCLLTWPNPVKDTCMRGGLFTQWHYANGYYYPEQKIRTKLALQISRLPARRVKK